MPRRGKAGRAQSCALRAAKGDDVEALLEVECIAQADAPHEVDESIATAEKDVLAVIHLVSIDEKRGRAAPEQPRALEDLHVVSRFFKVERGC
jgi:hypothetical protein